MRKALTGSFLAATLEGIKPEINVSSVLIATKIIACSGFKTARFVVTDPAATALIIALIIGHRIYEIPIPINPAPKPIIYVSELNTRDISFLRAPILRSTPISFVLSITLA